MHVAIVASVAVLAWPAAAGAAEVHLEPHGPDRPQALQATYTAADGEANDLTVRVQPTSFDDFVLTFSDAGAVVQAGNGCVSTGPHGARCAAGFIDAARVDLGDRDDRMVADERTVFQDYFHLRVNGGDGADRLSGSLNWDFLDGGAGRDRIDGHGGQDTLAGGTGVDRVDGGGGNDHIAGESFDRTPAVANDRLEGGTGNDTVDYRGGAERVHVDLARHVGGVAPREHDRLAGIENASLHAGYGTLAGNAHANVLYLQRNAGPAVLRGRRGADELTGGPAADAIYGGRGEDDIQGGGGTGDVLHAGSGRDFVVASALQGSAHTGWARSVHCGRGGDVVFDVRRHDLISHDCEDIATYARLGISPRLRVVGGDSVELSVHRRGPHTACRYAIELRAPFPQSADAHPRQIGRVVFRQDRKTWRRIRVRLNDYGRRLVARPGPLPVWVNEGDLERCAPGYTLGFYRDGFTALL